MLVRLAQLSLGAAPSWMPALSMVAVPAARTLVAVAAAAASAPSAAAAALPQRRSWHSGSGNGSGSSDGVHAADLLPPSHGAAVVLVSGGIESAALLSYWKHWDHGHRLYPLFVQFGQHNAAEEERAAAALCSHLGLDLAKLDVGLLGDQLRVLRGPRSSAVPVPHRDLMLLSLGASYAAEVGASQQVLALSHDDVARGATSTAFLHHADAMLQMLDPPLRLLTPLAGLTRAGLIRVGQQVGAPWSLTYSCAHGGGAAGQAIQQQQAAAAATSAEPEPPGIHCGTCLGCRSRMAAFAEAGVRDGAVYAAAEA